jgi:predicted TIM-barrel fold metal-dependent hydrolase
MRRMLSPPSAISFEQSALGLLKYTRKWRSRMHCTKSRSMRTRLSQPLAAAVLSAAWLLLPPAANAQNQPLNQMQAEPQGQSPTSTIPDQKLSAAATAIGQVASIRQSYERRISEASPSDKERLTDEAYDALEKAVTDQGLSIDEYNTIVKKAQNDPATRQRLAQLIGPSGR